MIYAKIIAGAGAAAALALFASVAAGNAQTQASFVAAPRASATVITSTIAPSVPPATPPVTPPPTPPVVTPSAVPPPAAPGSDRRLAAQLPVVDRVMDILQHARDDYNGDRARAIDALNKAREDLRAALKADNITNIPNTPIESAAGSESGSMAQSNEHISDARSMLDQVIANLQRDNHDYHGYRVKAIEDVRNARADLTDALVDVNRGGGGNKIPSDRSVAGTLASTERAIDTLQRARMDYEGHRAAAIKALNDAREDLAAALKADSSHEVPSPVPTVSASLPGGTDDTSQAASNARLREARALVVAAIANLKNDNHDYGGYRVQAIEDLQLAQSELDKALASIGG